MRLMLASLGLAGALLAAAPASAHEAMTLAGKVVRVDEAWIDITTDAGGYHTVMINRGTRVFVGEKTADPKQLRVGQQVVIDGYGDSLDDLLARGIHILPAGTARAK